MQIAYNFVKKMINQVAQKGKKKVAEFHAKELGNVYVEIPNLQKKKWLIKLPKKVKKKVAKSC